MKVSVSYRSILALAAPISVALFLPQINFFTNTAFLGRLGERELGVNGVAGIFYLLLQMIGYGLANGLQTQLSRRAGEGDKKALAHTLANGAMMALLLAVVLIAAACWIGPMVFRAGLHREDDVVLSIDYLLARVWGLPALVLGQVLQGFFVATGKSRALSASSAVTVAANVVLDYAFIFGHWGAPGLGLQGAALASAMAEWAGCLTLIALFLFTSQHRKYPLTRQAFRPDLALSKTTLRIAAPLMLQYGFSIGGWVVFFLFIEHLGSPALAASQILRSVFGLVSISTWAFASTTSSMVSNLIGQGKSSLVPLLVGRIIKVSLGLTGILCVALLIAGPHFLALYRNDPQLIAYALPSLYVVSLATLVMSVSTVTFNGVVGTGNTLANMTIEVTSVAIYLVYCAIVIEKMHAPLHWAWASEFVYWLSLLVISAWYLRSGRWRGKLV